MPEVQIPRWTDHVGSLPDSHQITVARDGGRIIEAKRSGPGGENYTVGNVVFSEAAVVGEVEYLFVHPEAIGAGVRRLLLGAFVSIRRACRGRRSPAGRRGGYRIFR